MRMSDIWAPEIHDIRGEWWVYFSGADPVIGNPSHRMYVLRGPASDQNPMDATSHFEFLGPLKNMPDQWAIDGTVIELDDYLYMVYSGWPEGQFNTDMRQELYIVLLNNP